MEHSDCTIGIDLGTSSVKVVLLDMTGTALSSASRTYEISSPSAGWAEADPWAWLAAARDAVADILSANPSCRVIGLAVDGQMHGVVITDSAGAPVRPAVLWPDSRADAIVDQWRAELDEPALGRLSNPLAAGMAGPIVSWLSRNEPDVVRDGSVMLFAKDWLRAQLVPGSFVTDPSDASASLLWDAPGDRWDEERLRATGAPRALFPPVRASDEAAGLLDAEIAAQWGLPPAIPVAVGSGDVAATLLGLGAEPGALTLIVGTGAQALMPGIVAEPRPNPPFHTYRSWDRTCFAMAAVTNAGLALRRILDLLDASWSDLYASAEHAPGTATPFFLPYFTGERFVAGAGPGRAAWSGLDLATQREDMLYAALEGVAFSIAQAVQAMPPSNRHTIDVVGGGSSDARFLQLLADATGHRLRLIDVEHATAIGAARLAARAAGADIPEARHRHITTLDPRPRSDLTRRYRAFRTLIDDLSDERR